MNAFLIVIVAAYIYILEKYWKLYTFSKRLAASENQKSVEQEIVRLAERNPKWITLITQTIVLMCLVLLISKLL